MFDTVIEVSKTLVKVEDSPVVKDGAGVGITPQLEGAGWQHPSFAVASPEVLSRLLIFKRRASPAPTSNLHLLHLPSSKLVQKPTRRPLLIFRLFLTGHGLTDRRPFVPLQFCQPQVLAPFIGSQILGRSAQFASPASEAPPSLKSRPCPVCPLGC